MTSIACGRLWAHPISPANAGPKSSAVPWSDCCTCQRTNFYKPVTSFAPLFHKIKRSVRAMDPRWATMPTCGSSNVTVLFGNVRQLFASSIRAQTSTFIQLVNINLVDRLQGSVRSAPTPAAMLSMFGWPWKDYTLSRSRKVNCTHTHAHTHTQ